MISKLQNSINKILVVGLGSIGKRHVRILRTLYPNIEIIVLRHNKCDDADIALYALSSCVTAIEDALALQPDAAIIATPATKHLETAKKLANAGVHLLIEKPISATTTGVQSLIDLCKKNRVTLMTAYNLRFQPSLQEFRKNIQKNKIGRVLSVRAEVGQYLPSWRPDSDYRDTVSAQKRSGGGVLLELSHEIDYLAWVFGNVEWVKAHVSKQSDLEIDVEDIVNVIFGAKSKNENEIVVLLNMDFVRHDNIRQCTAVGDKGSLRWDAIAGEVAWFSQDGKGWKVLFSQTTERDYTYTKEINHFFNAIEKKEEISISGKDGLNALKVIKAIHKSHDSSSMVSL
jgi:predicted dehydrogenase